MTDFNRLREKINELTALQDLVEQLADQVQFVQKQVEGVRHEHNRSPLRIENRVGMENVKSSMTPSTMLFSDLKNRRSASPADNISIDLAHHSPMTDKVRQSLFAGSRLSKYLADRVGQRDRDFIEIDNKSLHRDKDLANRLFGSRASNFDDLETSNLIII